jgi:hypothetical protein
MGIVDVARDALKEIPMADIIRERLSLALDRLSEAERQIATLQTEKGGVQAQFERERFDHEKTKEELTALKEGLKEQTCFVHGVEFRRGTRTGDKWLPFCPKCHLPMHFADKNQMPYCNDSACGWIAGNTSVASVLEALGPE